MKINLGCKIPYKIPDPPKNGVKSYDNLKNRVKACCASRGFSIDESIMDEPPSAEFPNAQFSIGNEFGFRFRSMNETHFVQRRVENSFANFFIQKSKF